MGKKVRVAAPEVAEFSLNVDLVNGNSVEIVVKYPKGEGLSAITALGTMSSNERVAGLMHALKDDSSVKEYMKDRGIGFADDEDDDY